MHCGLPRLASTILVVAQVGQLGCLGGLSAAHLTPSAPVDVAGVERCRIAAKQERPLVTEWGASEKADLESRLSSGQVVAVRYTGCELQIVEGCRPPGKYSFRRTTLSTDTVEINDADDLYAKLPLGAVGLEGELQRSGRLAVRTTVAGEYRLDAPADDLSKAPGCGEATHVVSGVAVGAFSLLSGGAVSASAGVDAKLGSAGGSGKHEESTVRQAGDDRSCRDATDAAPNAMCASPLQVFLSRLHAEASAPGVDDAKASEEAADRRARTTGILLDIPAPSNAGEQWTLHDADGHALCDAPCSRWVAPRSGYYLERPPNGSADGVRIDLPNDLPAAGSHATADYGPEKGMPFLSRLTFYGVGIPCAALAVGLGIAFAADTRSELSPFYAGSAVMFAAFAGVSTWWFYSSDDKHFRVKADGPAAPHATFTPTGVVGTF